MEPSWRESGSCRGKSFPPSRQSGRSCVGRRSRSVEHTFRSHVARSSQATVKGLIQSDSTILSGSGLERSDHLRRGLVDLHRQFFRRLPDTGSRAENSLGSIGDRAMTHRLDRSALSVRSAPRDRGLATSDTQADSMLRPGHESGRLLYAVLIVPSRLARASSRASHVPLTASVPLSQLPGLVSAHGTRSVVLRGLVPVTQCPASSVQLRRSCWPSQHGTALNRRLELVGLFLDSSLARTERGDQSSSPARAHRAPAAD